MIVIRLRALVHRQMIDHHPKEERHVHEITSLLKNNINLLKQAWNQVYKASQVLLKRIS